MSMFSGKCDLADHIAGCAGWYDRDGNPVKFGDPGVGAYYSDEYRDFIEFKKQTGGVLHQHKVIKLTPWNHEEVKKLCPEFDYQEHTRIVLDKRVKSGQREEKYLTYTYWGKEYTLAELNKRKIYIEIDIKFDTILDLIPYYPYIVCCAAHKDGKSYVVISERSFVDEELDDHLDGGWYSELWQHYKKELQEHYFEICRDYLCYKLDERTKTALIKDLAKTEDSNYSLFVDDELDCNHKVEFVWDDGKLHSHWTSPKQANAHEIIISHEDVEGYLREDIKNETVKIKYVKLPDGGFPVNLG